ncbi:MAG: zinc-binding alcohol dehydrogenase family protein [Candidatus Acidiferrales bacterium]
MKALRFDRFGDLTALRVEEIPTPAPGMGEVLVRVCAASINPSDVKNVLGKFKATVLPRTPGRDLAGIVVGGDTSMAGQEVWAAGGDIGSTRDGSHAEFIVLPKLGARLKPENLSMVEAASVGINYITAYAGLIQKAQLKEREPVLVTGALGGVGSSVVKLAKIHGARVIGIDRHAPKAGGLGIDLGLSSETDDIKSRVNEFTAGKGVNVVFDAVGGPLFESALSTLGFDGRQVNIVSVGTTRVSFDLQDFYHRRLTLYGVDTAALGTVACGEILDGLRPSFEQGKLTPPPIAKTISLDEAVEAYKDIDSGKMSGKVVIKFPDTQGTGTN